MKLRDIIISGFMGALCVSCADTEQYVAPVEVPLSQPSYDEVLADWESALPSTTFVDATETVPTDTASTDYDDYVENEDFKESRTVTITWSGTEVSIDNTQAEKGVIVTANGGYVTIQNLESEEDADDARGRVTYLLQGTSANGQLKVYSQKKFQLKLNDLTLTCPDGPAISIQKKKRCFITCPEGTVNTLTDSATYASDLIPTDEDEKGCLFSEGQLIFSGSGSLVVFGHHNHAIASDEYIRIHSGCNISIQAAAKDGIHTKQQYLQTGGLVRSYADKDALQSDSLGITVSAGYLYLAGSRAYTVNGDGQYSVTAPGQVCALSWGE